ncbi:DUF2306 domain-containing protein [Alloacidobacterium dinghuense]|uniref:DUF2306 domain-containing protein n=1 Tax=Alloacidobacterium dinghuense TaxID=2763107 RepID=A0A7G8BPE3_9BACT|nr:DUF2306 domain-containing protein [Alloacidobacterium dinghuense]QNI34413.1 DUF2306 domain-containing protein [Alloacidobacterium dinghuense]
MPAHLDSAENPTILIQKEAFPRVLRVGFWMCVVIAVAVVIRRIVVLLNPPQSPPPQMAGLDQSFASHTALTLAHILPALAFVLLLPFIYFSRFARALWIERLLFALGAIVGITAYAMSTYAIGGWTERSAVYFFNSLFLYSLFRAWQYRRTGALHLKQQWLTRAVAVLLGIATTRPVMGVLFATSTLTHLKPQQFFGIAFWIGFSINTIAIELWLRSRKHPFQFETTAVHS